MKLLKPILTTALAVGALAVAAQAGDDAARQKCLEAADQGDSAKTIELCKKALAQDPEDQAVREALKVAQAEAKPPGVGMGTPARPTDQ